MPVFGNEVAAVNIISKMIFQKRNIDSSLSLELSDYWA